MVEEINAGNTGFYPDSIKEQAVPVKRIKNESKFVKGQEVNYGSPHKIVEIEYQTNFGCFFYKLQPLPHAGNGNKLRLVSEGTLLQFNKMTAQ